MHSYRRTAIFLIVVFLATGATRGLGGQTPIVAPPAASPAPYSSKTELARPRLFGEGVISTEDDEIGGTFSPDGRDFYFVKRTPSTIVSSLVAICVSHYDGRRWQRPRIASFSGQYVD